VGIWDTTIKSYVNLATYFDEDNTAQNKTESEMQKYKETTYYRNAVRVWYPFLNTTQVGTMCTGLSFFNYS
jgi:phage regulator Rha-like protein